MVRQYIGETDPRRVIEGLRASLDELERDLANSARRDDALLTAAARLEEGGAKLRKFVASSRALR